MTDPRQQLFDRLEAAVADGVCPGAVAAVWRDGAVLYHEAHGRLATHPWAAVADIEVARETVFDLASLTKVLATTTLAAQLVSEGRLDLATELPDPWRRAAPGATLADLLEHASGLAAHREYFTQVEPFDRAKLVHLVLATPRECGRHERAIYSDLGFILLGEWLERVLDRPLDEAFADRVAYRLGLDDDPRSPALGFRPHASKAALAWELERRIAPTEVYDPALHPAGVPSHFAVRAETRLAHGTVHDDNAWVMGGVAGHAGLFGSALAVLEVGRAWCDNEVPGVSTDVHQRFLRASTVPGSTRRLGWDGIARDGSGSTGLALAADAFGHTGFTGTSLWIDPKVRLVAVLLTNRVHPTRSDDRIKSLRVAFHEAAARL